MYRVAVSPQSGSILRVVVADDHRFFREGVRGILEGAGMEVIGEASDGAEAVTLTQALEPDVVVMDLNMPHLSGVEATRRILAANPAARVVVLTVSEVDGDVLDAMATGACGYLIKSDPPHALVAAVRNAMSEHAVISRVVVEKLVRGVAEDARAEPAATPRPELTEREVEVLRLLAQGADNAAIGRGLFISPHTVKQYVAHIFEKLGVRTRTEAAVEAVRMGLV